MLDSIQQQYQKQNSISWNRRRSRLSKHPLQLLLKIKFTQWLPDGSENYLVSILQCRAFNDREKYIFFYINGDTHGTLHGTWHCTALVTLRQTVEKSHVHVLFIIIICLSIALSKISGTIATSSGWSFLHKNFQHPAAPPLGVNFGNSFFAPLYTTK